MNYINNKTLAYPLSEQDIKSANPLKSFQSPFIPPKEYSVVFAVPTPVYDTVLETVQEIEPTLTKKGHWEQTFKIVSLFNKATDKVAAKQAHLDAQKSTKKDQVNASRKVKESVGFSYKFPKSLGTVQTSDTDIRNVLAITTTALVLQSQKVIDAIIPFRDMENVVHMLTPQQGIDLGMAVQNFISTTYIESWATKSNIDAATTIIKLNEITT